MGSYLLKPVTEKESTDETNDKLVCGASSMQGWRLSQEDAHNCILDFDTNTSFFAVYDGHGGHDVAQYCSENLPEFIKNTPEYQEHKIEDALRLGFLRFDKLIATPEVRKILKKIACDKVGMDDSDEEENVKDLYEEAAMPIEQVIEKYTASSITKSDDKKPEKDSDATVGTSSASCSSSSEIADKCGDGVSSSSEAGTSDKNGEATPSEANGPETIQEAEPSMSDASEIKAEVESTSAKSKDEAPVQNGEISTPSSEAQPKSDVTSSSSPVENGTPSKKGKGKAVIKPDAAKKTPVNTRPKRNAQQLYKQWLDCGEDSEESDEEDQTFEGPPEESSEEDGDGVNVAIDVSEEDEEEEESSEDEDDDNEEGVDDEEEGGLFVRTSFDEAGLDSGCTAVVALLKGNELYVANAGDSRCIVCRNGKAIEMSVDHKPEDELELQRIKKAGGSVSYDGRVDGGLNLSRAIGDHAYKNNKDLPAEEQMITALPDIKTLTINPSEDEFMVLACDGIWNSMSSQEVVDFVRPRMLEGREKMSQICEEIFDHCLSPNKGGDGTGCDNMTAIIVKFKASTNKRDASPPPEVNAKRVKTDTDTEPQVDTTV